MGVGKMRVMVVVGMTIARQTGGDIGGEEETLVERTIDRSRGWVVVKEMRCLLVGMSVLSSGHQHVRMTMDSWLAYHRRLSRVVVCCY
jgi:hypothetical protein